MAEGGRLALVVGASRGIGLGLVRELAGRGWRVIATARQPEAAAGLQQAVSDFPGHVEVERLDIDDAAGLEALAARLEGRRLNLLLVNAGVLGPAHQSVAHATADELGALMLTNAVAPVRLASRLMPLLAEGGTLAFTTSRMGSVADNETGGMDLYRASKAALNSLTRGLAANAAGQRGLRVLNLHPGWVKTDMGGAAAPVEVADSVAGLADVLEAGRPAGHYFLDYQGETLPW